MTPAELKSARLALGLGVPTAAKRFVDGQASHRTAIRKWYAWERGEDRGYRANVPERVAEAVRQALEAKE